MERTLKSCSLEETIILGIELGKSLPSNTILCLFGDLGAGKTSLVKGVVEGAAGVSRDQVNSPTFVYLNIYSGERNVYHFDLYRLHGVDDFISMGFDDYFFAGGICCIEWSERIASILPENALIVEMKGLSENERLIHIRG